MLKDQTHPKNGNCKVMIIQQEKNTFSKQSTL